MPKKIKICIILGTRPEIVKMSSVIKECQNRKLNFFVLHTNQHYSENLDKIFFDELNLPQPKYNLKIGSCMHGEQIAKAIIGIEKILLEERPSIVLVEGDTNTVLAGALAASKLNIKVGHVEAGLRSYFREMPEEINRILTDHCSDLLFAPTVGAQKILLGEGILPKKVFVVGNTVVDAVLQNFKFSKVQSSDYILLTLHRQENTDNVKILKNIFEGVGLVIKKFGFLVIYPMHPRTRKMIKVFGVKIPKGVKIIDPVGYLDFLQLEKNARMILTDSGGVQEETCILKVPCVTLRDNTERPETLQVGSNILSGTEPSKILKSTSLMLNKKRIWLNPFGKGESGKKIIEIILRNK